MFQKENYVCFLVMINNDYFMQKSKQKAVYFSSELFFRIFWLSRYLLATFHKIFFKKSAPSSAIN